MTYQMTALVGTNQLTSIYRTDRIPLTSTYQPGMTPSSPHILPLFRNHQLIQCNKHNSPLEKRQRPDFRSFAFASFLTYLEVVRHAAMAVELLNDCTFSLTRCNFPKLLVVLDANSSAFDYGMRAFISHMLTNAKWRGKS